MRKSYIFLTMLLLASLLVLSSFLPRQAGEAPLAGEAVKKEVSYRIAEDDASIHSEISSYMLGKDLVVEYSSDAEPRIEGLASNRYRIEDGRIVIYDYGDEYFRIVFGKASDVYEFGTEIQTTTTVELPATQPAVPTTLQPSIPQAQTPPSPPTTSPSMAAAASAASTVWSEQPEEITANFTARTSTFGFKGYAISLSAVGPDAGWSYSYNGTHHIQAFASQPLTYSLIWQPIKADGVAVKWKLTIKGDSDAQRTLVFRIGLDKGEFAKGDNIVYAGRKDDAGKPTEGVGFDWSDAIDYFDGLDETQASNKAGLVKFKIPKGSFEIDPSVVGTSTVASATLKSLQRKTFYATGRFWVFYTDGTNFVWRTSTDGTTWSDAQIITAGLVGNYLSIFFDGTYVHYANSDGGYGDIILYRRGIPSANGNIAWSSAANALLVGDTYKCLDVNVAVDSSGYPFIGYHYTDGSAVYEPRVTKSATNDSTWSTATGFPKIITGTDDSTWRVSVVPLTSLKMYAVAARTSEIVGMLWNGTAWGSLETATTLDPRSGDRHSSIAVGDNVYIAFLEANSYDIHFIVRTYGVGWGAAETVRSAALLDSNPVLSVDVSSGNIYCFWAGSPTANHIYYKKRAAGTWDTNPTDWITETALTANDKLTCFYNAYGSKIGLVYMTLTASPYNVKFDYLNLCAPPTSGDWTIASGRDCVCNTTWGAPANLHVYGNLTMQNACNITFANSTSTSGAASTVGTSTVNDATFMPFQRKSFYANGRFWVFYSDGTNMVYRTSTDGTTWSTATTIRAGSIGYYFSIWFDGTFVHYVYSFSGLDNNPILYRRGTPNADGTITWSAAEQTAVAAVSNARYYFPSVSVDSSGYAWIGYFYSGNFNPYVTKSGNNDGTWGTTPVGFPYQLSTVANDAAVSAIPLTAGKMLVIYAPSGSTVKSKQWTGSSWGAERATTSSIELYFYYSAVAQGDDVHLVFLNKTTYNIFHTKYTYASDAWGTETTVQAATTNNTGPVLSIDAANSLHCFWAGSPTSDHIYYKKRIDGVWDASPTDWITETALTGYKRLTSFGKSYDSRMGLVYMTKTGSPYDIRFNYLNFTTPQYIYVYAGGAIYMYSEAGFNKP